MQRRVSYGVLLCMVFWETFVTIIGQWVKDDQSCVLIMNVGVPSATLSTGSRRQA